MRAEIMKLENYGAKIFKPELVSIDIDAKENGDQYECELNLNYGDSNVTLCRDKKVCRYRPI